jgi:hypothetical protein
MPARQLRQVRLGPVSAITAPDDYSRLGHVLSRFRT